MSSYVDRDTQGGYRGGGGGDNDVRYDIHHVTLSSPSHHHAIIMPSLNAMTNSRAASYVDTQSYHHHHIITQSSCNDLRMSSYVDRDTQGGYRGGGGWVRHRKVPGSKDLLYDQWFGLVERNAVGGRSRKVLANHRLNLSARFVHVTP